MQLIDTHCHLVSEKLRGDLSGVLARAQAAGVHKILNVAYDPETVTLALEQTAQSDILYAAVGIQPHDASQFTVAEGEKIKRIAQTTKKVVAIGEIGLDDHHTLSPLEKQMECFEFFLNVAVEVKLPVVVHVRETHDAVLRLIKQFVPKGLTGVIHCFTGTANEAKDFLDQGLFLSFSGIVTFKNAAAIQESARYTPLDRILIETDSPYLSPVPLRGKLNEPGHLPHTCEFVARLKGMSVAEFAPHAYQNSLHLFKKMS